MKYCQGTEYWGRMQLVKTKPPTPRYLCAALASVAAFIIFPNLVGCVSVKTEHRVEPIQITMDVNVRLERELEDVFGDLDAQALSLAEQHTEKGSE